MQPVLKLHTLQRRAPLVAEHTPLGMSGRKSRMSWRRLASIHRHCSILRPEQQAVLQCALVRLSAYLVSQLDCAGVSSSDGNQPLRVAVKQEFDSRMEVDHNDARIQRRLLRVTHFC